MNRSLLPPAAFVACGVIWSSTFLVIRVGDEAMPAFWGCFLRLVVATLVLSVILAVTRQPWPKGEGLIAAFWFGFFEFGVGFPLLYWGEKVVPSGLAAVLYAVCPITGMIAAKILGLEKLNPRKFVAGLIAFAGVAIIFWREVLAGGSPGGYAAILLAAVAAPIAGLLLERGPRQNAIGVNAVGCLVGLVPTFVLSFICGEKHEIPTGAKQIFPVLYLAILSSVIAFGLFAWLINHWRATTVAFLGVIIPVFAVILGAVVRHERFAPGAMVGAIVVIAGVLGALRAEMGGVESAHAH